MLRKCAACRAENARSSRRVVGGKGERQSCFFSFLLLQINQIKILHGRAPFPPTARRSFLRSKRFVFGQYGGGDHPHSGNITEETVRVRVIFPRSGDLADGQGCRQDSREDENPSNVIERWDIQRRFDIVCFVAVWRKFKTNQQVSRYLNG